LCARSVRFVSFRSFFVVVVVARIDRSIDPRERSSVSPAAQRTPAAAAAVVVVG